MPAACLMGIAVDSGTFFLAGASFSVAVILLAALTRLKLSTKKRIVAIYAHLFSVFFPFVLLSTNFACGALCLPCFEHPISLALLSLPTTLLLSGLAGFIIIPGHYILSRKTFVLRDSPLAAFVKRMSGTMGIRPPALYILNRAKPLAFSFRGIRSAIFLSVGLLELLGKRETEAVLLHEMAHIRFRSSLMKLSTHLLRFSPFFFLKNFHQELGAEEEKADEIVVRVQGTGKHLLSAKRKIDSYSHKGG